jgi:hypothetical protein
MRNICKQNFFEVLRFKISFTEDEIQGFRALRISSYEAFIFSTITGAQYLDDLVLPFTPKGLMKVFHSHLNDRLVTGLWSGLEPHYSPRMLAMGRPFLNNGEKYLVPIEFHGEAEFREKAEELFKKQDYPGQILVHRIEASKEGNGQESLLEYISCEYFRSRGFLVDSQIPMAQEFGSPDWMAVSPSRLTDQIEIFKGRYLFELGMSAIDWDSENISITPEDELSNNILVGEAKVSSGDHVKQITKYLRSGIFNRAVLSVTDRQDKYLDLFDQFYLDESWKMKFVAASSSSGEFDPYKSEEFSNFLTTVAKFYLLSNFSNSQISERVEIDISDKVIAQSKLLSSIRAKPLAHFLIS